MTISDFMIKALAPNIGFTVCPHEHIGEKDYTTCYGILDNPPNHVCNTEIKYFSLEYVEDGSGKGNFIYKFYI